VTEPRATDVSSEPSYLQTSRGRFAVRSFGDDSSPLILALHGFPDTPASWAPVAGLLAQAGYRVVAPFMRGYSPSTLDGPFDVESIADDARALGDVLSPSKPFVVLGHDWGAAVAYVAATRLPERLRCVVALSVPHPVAFLRGLARSPAQLRRSWYMALFQVPFLAERLLARRDFALVERLWSDWSPDYRLHPEQLRELKRCLRASLPAPIAYYRAMAWPPREALQRIRASATRDRRVKVPLLHLTGADDGCIGPEAGRGQSEFFEGPFRSETLAGVGHFMQLERPELVAREVLAWLAAWAG
jgi:pimeloyl-ACP methyl ester carboxylesterase